MGADSAGEYVRVVGKLLKWKMFFASWQLGTRPDTDGECRALKHHLEMSISLRAEVNALTGLLVSKGVISMEEWTEALIAEVKRLDHDYEESYPGWRSTALGMSMKLPEAMETAKELGFPA